MFHHRKIRWRPTRSPLPSARAANPATWISPGRSTCQRCGSRTRSRSSGRSGRRTSTSVSWKPCSYTAAPGAASKVVRESSGSNTSSTGAAPAIQIPPPRPKRKPAHPYPRKVDGAAKKQVPALRQLEKPPPRMQSPCDQDEGSPTSVLTTARTVSGATALGSVFANSTSGSRSPASSIDREDGSVSPSIATAELATRTANTKVFGDAKEAPCIRKAPVFKLFAPCIGKAPVFKLFGKKVLVKDSNNEELKNDGGLKMDAPPAEGGSWNQWPSGVQQLVYFLPQPNGFAAQSAVPWLAYNGLFYPQAMPSAEQHQPSEPLDHKRMQREGSLTGSNTPSSAVPPAAQSSDAAESHSPGQENTCSESVLPAAVPRLTKCAGSASFSRRGFVPYRRCAAESEAPRPVAAAGEADGELTRLCL